MRSRELLLGVSSQAGHAGQRLLLASGQLVQNKVKVGRGGHGVEHVGLVRDEQVWEEEEGAGGLELILFPWLRYKDSGRWTAQHPTSSLGDDLHQGEVAAAEMLQVVLLQGLLNHLHSFVLARQLPHTRNSNQLAACRAT